MNFQSKGQEKLPATAHELNIIPGLTKKEYYVVHPLWDEPEIKVDIDNAGPMYVNKATWLALFALRAYLIIMIVLAAYRFMCLAHILK
jgi:hypothetical protein